jgi:hypothetical protein
MRAWCTFVTTGNGGENERARSAAAQHAGTRPHAARGAVSRAPVRWYPGAVRTGGDAERRSAARCVRALGGDCCRGRQSSFSALLLASLSAACPLPPGPGFSLLCRCMVDWTGAGHAETVAVGGPGRGETPSVAASRPARFTVLSLHCAALLPSRAPAPPPPCCQAPLAFAAAHGVMACGGAIPSALCLPPPPLPPVPPTSSHRTLPSPSPHPLLPPFSCAWPR